MKEVYSNCSFVRTTYCFFVMSFKKFEQILSDCILSLAFLWSHLNTKPIHNPAKLSRCTCISSTLFNSHSPLRPRRHYVPQKNCPSLNCLSNTGKPYHRGLKFLDTFHHLLRVFLHPTSPSIQCLYFCSDIYSYGGKMRLVLMADI